MTDYKGGHLNYNNTERIRCASRNNCAGLISKNASDRDKARTTMVREHASRSVGGFFEEADFIRLREVSLSYTAPTTLATADTQLAAVNATLASIGAGQNVLDYTVQNLKSAVVNVRAAESTIRDVDMAEEMANFTKNNILKEAAQAMLGQANQGSMSILQLLR